MKNFFFLILPNIVRNKAKFLAIILIPTVIITLILACGLFKKPSPPDWIQDDWSGVYIWEFETDSAEGWTTKTIYIFNIPVRIPNERIFDNCDFESEYYPTSYEYIIIARNGKAYAFSQGETGPARWSIYFRQCEPPCDQIWMELFK